MEWRIAAIAVASPVTATTSAVMFSTVIAVASLVSDWAGQVLAPVGRKDWPDDRTACRAVYPVRPVAVRTKRENAICAYHDA